MANISLENIAVENIVYQSPVLKSVERENNKMCSPENIVLAIITVLTIMVNVGGGLVFSRVSLELQDSAMS